MKRLSNRTTCLLIPLVAVLAVAWPAPVSARTVPVTHSPSYVVVDNNGSSTASSQSPCSSSGACANGIRFAWTPGTCYQGDRFAPISIVWTENQKVPAGVWPLSVPCSTGLQLSWNTHNQLIKAAWVGSQIPPTSGGLAVCWQFKSQCHTDHCVTAGCLPQHVNGVDIFFQGDDSLQAAEWQLKGQDTSSLPISGSPDDVYWYGMTPPASPFASSTGGSASESVGQPTVAILGRNNNLPVQTMNLAPASANGVDFSWYLPLYESGPGRGCFSAGGQLWKSPPLAFAYTTGGALNSRITAPTCSVDSSGAPMSYNDVNFGWAPAANGNGNTLTSAVPRYDWNSGFGCQKASTNARASAAARGDDTPVTYPPNTLPQPPAGTDGVLFSFNHDDFKSSCWTQSGTVLGRRESAPGHPRLADWQG